MDYDPSWERAFQQLSAHLRIALTADIEDRARLEYRRRGPRGQAHPRCRRRGPRRGPRGFDNRSPDNTRLPAQGEPGDRWARGLSLFWKASSTTICTWWCLAARLTATTSTCVTTFACIRSKRPPTGGRSESTSTCSLRTKRPTSPPKDPSCGRSWRSPECACRCRFQPREGVLPCCGSPPGK